VRHYRGHMADSARWERFEFREDDVVVSTPSKCGTTWMQNIVGMLLLDRTVLGAPVGELSPWLDMLIRTDAEVFDLLHEQTHRRWIKTHTPLDGLPFHPTVTYICVVRHPLDVALSDLDHHANQDFDRALELRFAASGALDPTLGATWSQPPDGAVEFLRWFIDNDRPPTGSGPNGLADFCEQVDTYWARRYEANVHLFHYGDLWNDLDGEMRRVAAVLDVAVDESRWPQFVAAATLESMRSRAHDTAPEAHLDMWHDAHQFFRVGGTREWASLLSEDDIAHFDDRLTFLAGPAAPWIVSGRVALD
jgi:aryl sulfotransferase